MKRGQKSTFTRKSWTPSKNASSIISHLHCQRQNRNGDWSMIIHPIPRLNLLPHTALHISSCCHAEGLMQESIGPCKVHPPAHPGGCGHTREENGMDEPFPQSPALGQLPVLWNSLFLRKLLTPEIPVLGMMKGRSPGYVIPWGHPFP